VKIEIAAYNASGEMLYLNGADTDAVMTKTVEGYRVALRAAVEGPKTALRWHDGDSEFRRNKIASFRFRGDNGAEDRFTRDEAAAELARMEASLGRVSTPAVTDNHTDSTTDTKGAAAMAATKKTAAKPETTAKATEAEDAAAKVREEIEANIERLASLVEAENAEGVADLKKATDSLVAKLPVKERNPLRQRVAAAATAQEKPEPAKSTEVAKATVSDVTAPARELDAKVDAAAAKVRDAAASAYGAGKEIARMLLDIRLTITKAGIPDLQADLDESKKRSTAVYTKVTEGLPDEGTDDAADVIRQGVDSVKKSAQNAMVDVVVEYVRSLDHSPEEAKRWAKVIEGTKGADGATLKPTDAVAKHFKLKLMTRAEIAKATRDSKKAIEKAQQTLDTAEAKLGTLSDEVDRKVAAGEMTAEEKTEALAPAKADVVKAEKELADAEEAAPGAGKAEKAKTPTEDLTDSVSKMTKLLEHAKVAGIAGLDDKGKKATRAKLEKIRDAVKDLLAEI
jgi:hypothetical protein